MREMYKLPEIVDLTNQLPKHPSKVWSRRTIESIKLMVQHHTASEAPLINQAKYHIRHHNWAGLAYTFVVDRGNIYQTNDLSSLTSHALGVNPFSVGVCVNGDLSKRPLTDFERKALTAIHFTLRELIPDLELSGHNEASLKYANHRTSCPCTDMDHLRTDLEALEESMHYISTPAQDRVTAYAFAERVQDLSKKLGDSKWGKAAQRKILLLTPSLEGMGYAGEVTPEAIVSRVIILYKQAMSGQYEKESLRKLMIGANCAKEVGLL